MYDLLICIRCHDYPDFVIDTARAAEFYTDRSTTGIAFAVDGGRTAFATRLRCMVGRARVFASSNVWRWGVGLWGLMAESIRHFERAMPFRHFMSIDYDTLFIGKGADRKIMDLISDESIGLLGCHRKENERWGAVFRAQRPKIERAFGSVPPAYRDGEGVQGGCMTLTRALINEMHCRDLLDPAPGGLSSICTIADDHLIALLTRICRLEIVDVTSFVKAYWTIPSDPRRWSDKQTLIFHPTKLTPHNAQRSTEVEIRNHFRQIRGEKGMLA